MARAHYLSGKEVFFDKNDIIVSKTNLKGHITYVNRVFLDISGFRENELLGQPHSLIRHPDMPRAVFKLLWETICSGQEIFAYVVNRCKNGDHYWVLAHVTPSFAENGTVMGYHSNRRVPKREIIQDSIIPLYQQLRNEENSKDRKQGLVASSDLLNAMLADKSLAYDEFILTL